MTRLVTQVHFRGFLVHYLEDFRERKWRFLEVGGGCTLVIHFKIFSTKSFVRAILSSRFSTFIH